jgi:alpha-beta hydrolase superfamily lysophospholipase
MTEQRPFMTSRRAALVGGAALMGMVYPLTTAGESGGKSGDHQRGQPLMVNTETNLGGLPKEVFDGLHAQLAASRAQKITVPVLVMHGDDDQMVPYADSVSLSAKLLRNSTLPPLSSPRKTRLAPAIGC